MSQCKDFGSRRAKARREPGTVGGPATRAGRGDTGKDDANKRKIAIMPLLVGAAAIVGLLVLLSRRGT